VGDLRPPSPALVALDDLQWADVSTMQLIRHLARSHHASGVLLVLSYRSGDVSASLADLLMDLNRELPLERIVLGGLTERDVAALLREWGSDAPAHEAQALHDRTDGNPFFIRELVRDRAEGRDPRQSVPQTVRDVVALRLARLDPAVRELLAAGAVAGPAFDPADANAVLDEPSTEAELVSVVDMLVGSGLVDDTERGPVLRFEHSLMRDAVYGELGAARRAALHRALADRLIRRHGSAEGPHLAEIAYHLRAGGSGRAAEWTIAAADYAFAAVAFDQAARLYGLAIAALPPGDDRRQGLVNRRAMASQLLFHAAFDAR
jgi:predicted ATPase